MRPGRSAAATPRPGRLLTAFIRLSSAQPGGAWGGFASGTGRGQSTGGRATGPGEACRRPGGRQNTRSLSGGYRPAATKCSTEPSSETSDTCPALREYERFCNSHRCRLTCTDEVFGKRGAEHRTWPCQSMAPCRSACDDRFCDGGVRLTNSPAWECQDAQCARTVVVVDRPVTRA